MECKLLKKEIVMGMNVNPVSNKNNTLGTVAGASAVGVVAGGVKYHLGSKKLGALLNDTLDLSTKSNISFTENVAKQFDKIEANLPDGAQAEGGLKALRAKMKDAVEIINAKARDLKVKKGASEAARIAKNAADKEAKGANLNLKAVTARINEITKQAGKSVNVKSALAVGAAAAVITAATVAVVKAIKNKKANKAA